MPCEIQSSGRYSGEFTAASAGTSEAQALITGEESHAAKYERGVQTLLADGGWAGTTWRVDAAFGVFGNLPLVGVTFGDAFVLVDSVNGGVDGPFAAGSEVDARGLLGSHTDFVIGSSLRHYSIDGCELKFAGRWHDGGPPSVTPPAGPRPGVPGRSPSAPSICPPGGSTVPTTPLATCWPNLPCYNPSTPGWARCVCSGLSGPWCCIMVEQHIGGNPQRVYHIVTYYNCGTGSGAPTGCPPAGCTAVKTETWY